MPGLPSPPALLLRQYCLLAFAAGIAALREPVAAGCALAVLLVFRLCKGRPLEQFQNKIALITTGLFCCCFALGLGWASFREPRPPAVPAWLTAAVAPSVSAAGDNLSPAPMRIDARVGRVEPLPDARLRLILRDIRPADASNASAYAGDLAVTFNDPTPACLPGMRVRLGLRLEFPHSAANPQLPDRDRLLADEGIFLIGRHGKGMPGPEYSGEPTWSQTARAGLRAHLESVLQLLKDFPAGKAVAAYAPALLFNDRSRLTSEQLGGLADAGLIHSLALSGMHLGYAAGAGYLLLRLFGRLRPRIFLRLPRPQVAALAALPPVLLCLWLGQAPVTLVRAFLMFLFWGLLLFLRRPKALLDGLLAALALMLLLNPQALFDIRLQLSCGAVAAIALSLPAVAALSRRLVPEVKNGAGLGRAALRGACSLLLISSAVQMVLLPLTAATFTSPPVLAPLNALWLPVLGFLVMPLLYLGLGLSLIAPMLAAVPLYPAGLLFRGLEAVLAFLHQAGLLQPAALPRPHPLSALGFWLLLLLLGGLALRRKPEAAGLDRRGRFRRVVSQAAGCAACLLLILLPPLWAAPGKQEVRLSLLDVGAGQAVFLEWAGGKALLDGGPAFARGMDAGRFITGPVVAYNALPRLDLVLATHPDADHLGGLLYELERFQVAAFAGNGREAQPELAARLAAIPAGTRLSELVLARGDALDFTGGLRLEILWPPKGAALQGNSASLVIRIVHLGRPLALVCGDADKAALETLADLDKSTLATPLLVLPHHGSAKSLCPTFYDAVSPRIVLTSSRKNSQWGFPARRVREEWEKRGVPLLDTGERGQIRIRRLGTEGNLEIQTTRPGS